MRVSNKNDELKKSLIESSFFKKNHTLKDKRTNKYHIYHLIGFFIGYFCFSGCGAAR